MIRRFLDIKNLGIFADFHWENSLPCFKEFNIIYGWNGSGKTTLSELFRAINDGKSETFPELKYKIEAKDGEFVEGSSYLHNVRVFNQNYVSQNIDTYSCKANPIFILGENNRRLAELIRNDEQELRGNPDDPNNIGKLRKLEIKKRELDSLIHEKNEKFTNVARSISSSITGVSSRNYRKNEAQNDFNLIIGKHLLSDEELDLCKKTIQQQEMEELKIISTKKVKFDVEKIIDEAKAILKQSVKVTEIERLRKNPRISKWVEEGFELHNQYKSTNCEFCSQSLPKDLIAILGGFFNEADQQLKLSLSTLVSRIDDLKLVIDRISVVDKANFFDEFRKGVGEKIFAYKNEKDMFIYSLNSLRSTIEDKQRDTSKTQNFEVSINFCSYIDSIDAINSIIKKHNMKARNFLLAKQEAEEKIKNHLFSEIFDEVNRIDGKLTELSNDINILENGDPEHPEMLGINQINARIAENKNKITNSGLACDEFNNKLETFLGRKELFFEDSPDGYMIKRQGEIAKNLSEGEKTAIAFVYFTIQLKDKDFNPKLDIVVVDDPISSLDSNSLFQAYSFLKTSLEKCCQVFVFTHDYEFLQMMINWRKNSSLGNKTNYYMIKNSINDKSRFATIDKLDKLLREYSSEYQYLFKLLYEFQTDGTIESVYSFPNIARKVLDTFLMIMIPNNLNPYQKLQRIKFDENKKTAIYKFTNDQSHTTGKGFDPSLVSETKNAITYLLEMIKNTFPEHYSILEESIKNSC